MDSMLQTAGKNPQGGKEAAQFGNVPSFDYMERSSEGMLESVLVLDNRALDRECFRRILKAQCGQFDVLAFHTANDWLLEKDRHPPVSVVILNVGGRKLTEEGVASEIRQLVAEFKPIPVIVLANTEDLSCVIKALEYGARGYIPSSVSIEVCVEAIKLAIAGGTFVPASSMMAVGRIIEQGEVSHPLSGMFTPRQAEVAMALRRGKANKIIAHELNLRESTVKVHIRNIMKKLRATNRTEVAYKIGDLRPAEMNGR